MGQLDTLFLDQKITSQPNQKLLRMGRRVGKARHVEPLKPTKRPTRKGPGVLEEVER